MNKNMQNGQSKEIRKQNGIVDVVRQQIIILNFVKHTTKFYKKAIQDKIDDLDMTLVIEGKN